VEEVISMDNCLFCRIVNKEIPAVVAYEDEQVMAFADINPQAPVHLLVIPKAHIPSLNDLDSTKGEIITAVFAAIARIAREQGLADDGYRVVVNCGQRAGQTVDHIHFHLLGGRDFGWPPG
jgi:histidine triad (HIT) family protein